MVERSHWSEWQESNLRPSGPKPDTLPNCATLRSVEKAPSCLTPGRLPRCVSRPAHSALKSSSALTWCQHYGGSPLCTGSPPCTEHIGTGAASPTTNRTLFSPGCRIKPHTTSTTRLNTATPAQSIPRICISIHHPFILPYGEMGESCIFIHARACLRLKRPRCVASRSANLLGL